MAGTITKYMLLAVNIGTGVFLMPFTVSHLGQAEYGLWMLIASMTYYFQLLDMGYGNGIVRHLVSADRRGDAGAMNRIVSTFVYVYAGLGFAVCVVAALLIVSVVPRFPRLTPAQVKTAQALLAIIGLRVAIGFPMTVFGAVTNARQGFVLNNVVAIATVLTSALVTFVVLEGGGSLIALVAATTAVNMLGYGGYAWTAMHVFPELKIRASFFSRSQWRDVTSLSVYLFLIQIAGQISFNIDNIVIGAFLGTAAVAVYTVALRLAEYQRRLCDQFSGMLFPVVIGFGADGNLQALRQTLIEGTRVAVTLVVGASVALIGFSGPLIRHWMGPSFDASIAPFVLLAVGGTIVVSQAAANNVLIAVGSHRLLAGTWVAEALANLTLSVVFVRRLGLAGVALGTLVPLMAGHVLVLLPRTCRAVGIGVRACLRDTWKPALIGGGAAAAVCAALRAAIPPETIHAIIGEGTATAVVYIAATGAVGFTRATREQYLAEIRAAWRSVAGWRSLRPRPRPEL